MKKHLFTKKNKLHIGDSVSDISSIGSLIVIAAGKAASEMAKQAENQLGNLITNGVCITKYHHSSAELKKISIIEAAHPVPDDNSIVAGEKVLQLVQNLSKNDIVLILLSGGASSLLADIPAGCTLSDIQKTNELLVNSGATIQEINIVRKHLSRIKGGHLAKKAYPAKVCTLLISDVVDDDLSSIASGPTVPDSSTFNDAYNIFVKYHLWKVLSKNIKNYIFKGLQNLLTETPKPGDIYFENSSLQIIANNLLALETAKQKAEELGYFTTITNNSLTGNTENEARKLVQFLLDYEGRTPACFLMGGETSIRITGTGKGGRNQHFVLCALDELRKYHSRKNHTITLLSAGTDGTDGPTDAAGAVISNSMIPLEKPTEENLKTSFTNYDAYHFFETHGGLLKSGPTQTNVMDMVIVLLDKKHKKNLNPTSSLTF